jgi:serine/threonine protein kinase
MLQPRAPPTLSQRTAIGSGATATVYKAYVNDRGGFSRLRPGQFVAVKEMIGVNPKRISIIEREVAMHKSIVHSHIVNYFGFYVPDDESMPFLVDPRPPTQSKVCILLEYCDAGSLCQLYGKNGGPLPNLAIRSYLYQALQGVAYLHARGIVHRDIKGLNLLLTREGTCKLGDFGCAVDLSTQRDGQFHSLQGTPFWMAPEMFEVSADGLGGDLAADIWSIGATAWELATGDRPFRQFNTDFQLALFFSEIKNDADMFPIDLETRVGQETFAFIKRCMKRNPADRPTAAELLTEPFFAQAAEQDHRNSQLHDEDDNRTLPAAGSSADVVAIATTVNDAATYQWLRSATGAALTASDQGGAVQICVLTTPRSVTSMNSSSPESHLSKLQDALTWWTTHGFRAECSASAFFDALDCANLHPVLFPVVVWGRDAVTSDTAASPSSSATAGDVVRFTDFIRFVQFFGPFENIVTDARELGNAGDAYGDYSGYANYGYVSDTPHMILTWHSQTWFKPDWSQQKAEDHLKTSSAGEFVIRFSSKWKESPGSFTLSVKGDRGVSHYRVLRPPTTVPAAWSFILVPHEKEVHYYDSLEEMIAHCRQIGVKSTKSDKIYKLL